MTIRDALNTLPVLRTPLERQTAFVAAKYAETMPCLSCGEIVHSYSDCFAEGWDLEESFPTAATCPGTKQSVSLCVPLVGGCFIVKKKEQ